MVIMSAINLKSIFELWCVFSATTHSSSTTFTKAKTQSKPLGLVSHVDGRKPLKRSRDSHVTVKIQNLESAKIERQRTLERHGKIFKESGGTAGSYGASFLSAGVGCYFQSHQFQIDRRGVAGIGASRTAYLLQDSTRFVSAERKRCRPIGSFPFNDVFDKWR